MANITKKTDIIVDPRESRSQIIEKLSAFPNISVIQQELQSGDYCSSPLGGLAIERKSASDLIASVMDKRIFEQVQTMEATYEKSVVLVEGDPYSTASGISEEAVTGLLSWIATLTNTSLIMAKNKEQTSELIARMIFHYTHGLGYEISLRSNKPKNQKFWAHFAVEGLPGVGPATAQKIVAHFGSIQRVFNAEISELMEVKGVGIGTAHKIYEAIRAKVN